jgi:hypothetical protein
MLLKLQAFILVEFLRIVSTFINMFGAKIGVEIFFNFFQKNMAYVEYPVI